MRTSSAWQRYAWIAGILYVIALVAETVVGLLGGGLSQNGSAAKIATALYDHRGRLLVVTYLSVVYAAMFPIYLSRLHNLLRGDTDRTAVPWLAGAGWRNALCCPACRQRRRYHRLARRETRVVRVCTTIRA